MNWYPLDADGEPDWAHPLDIIAYGLWFAQHRDAADIGQERFTDDAGRAVLVSTLYFGFCATTGPDGHPHVWETFVFGGGLDGFQRRYTRRDAAVAGHREAVQRARLWRDPPAPPVITP